MKAAVLGIDTSNYTTSVALASLAGEVLVDSRRLLPVRAGEVGLRQSDALFLHIRQWPHLLTQLDLSDVNIVALAVATRPCPTEGSYMPVFLAGQAFALSAATILKVPLFAFSHQEGHIRAAFSEDVCGEMPFLAVQISGGTTDVLYVTPRATGSFDIETLATSADLHAGQFVDRVGVHMGLPFPCGPALERVAGAYAALGGKPIVVPSSVKNNAISFSGPTTMAMRLLDRGAEHGAVALGVFRCISNSLEKVLRQRRGQPNTVLLCGGVAANTHIRSRLLNRLKCFKFLMAPPHLASDNAVGIALLGVDRLQREGNLC